MLDPIRPRSRSLTALVGVAAATLTAASLAVAPASATPVTGAPTETSAQAAPVTAAARIHELHARAGRAGTTLRTIYVTVSLSSSNPAEAGHPKALVQQRRSGKWRTVGTIRIPQAEGPPLTFRWRAKKAATLRVKVASLGLVSPTMKVPAAPKSPRSRYYVRKDRTGDGGAVLRVFKGGTAYGIQYAGMEYSCVAGRLDRPWLRLTSFDFGGWDVKYRTSGSWKRLTIRDNATPVGGPRTSLSGTAKRYFHFCAAPAFAAVTTDPNGL